MTPYPPVSPRRELHVKPAPEAAGGGPSSRWIGWALVLLAVAVPFILQALSTAPRAPNDVELGYLGTAYGIHETSVVGEGRDVARRIAQGGVPRPSMAVDPLYPGFLAGVMALDADLRGTVACLLKAREAAPATPCFLDYGSLPWLQSGLAALTVALVAFAGRMLSGSLAVAGLAGLLAGVSSTYLRMADRFQPDVLIAPLLAALAVLLVMAARNGGIGRWFACGLLVGALALVAAPYRYLVGLIGLLLFSAWLFGWPRLVGLPPGQWLGAALRGALLAAVPLVVGFALVVGPWIGRNLAQFQTPALTSGLGFETLAPRFAYNRMSAAEWAVAFVYWLPDVGDDLVRRLFEPDLHRRLDLGTSDGFYQKGREIVSSDAKLAGVPPLRSKTDYLVEQELLGNVWRHLLVTLPLAWRGFFIAKYWSLAAAGAMAAVAWFALRRRRDEILLFMLPPLGMLFFFAFTSINLPNGNPGLIAPGAVSMAMALAWTWSRLRTRLPWPVGGEAAAAAADSNVIFMAHHRERIRRPDREAS